MALPRDTDSRQDMREDSRRRDVRGQGEEQEMCLERQGYAERGLGVALLGCVCPGTESEGVIPGQCIGSEK